MTSTATDSRPSPVRHQGHPSCLRRATADSCFIGTVAVAVGEISAPSDGERNSDGLHENGDSAVSNQRRSSLVLKYQKPCSAMKALLACAIRVIVRDALSSTAHVVVTTLKSHPSLWQTTGSQGIVLGHPFKGQAPLLCWMVRPDVSSKHDGGVFGTLPVDSCVGSWLMETDLTNSIVESLTLRFEGKAEDGSPLHELRASHVAEVLQGLVGLSSDFAKAGVFGDGPVGSELLVRPPKEGSFLIEVLRVVQESPEIVAAGTAVVGVPTLSQVIWWATKSARADVSNFQHLKNGRVKVSWQDGTAQEVPRPAWEELQKRDKRRKKQLRQIMAPLSDVQVSSVEIEGSPTDEVEMSEAPEVFTLTRPDYDAVRPDDETSESQNIFEIEAQMSAIDFDNPTKWRVRTKDSNRAAIVEDTTFLTRVANGLAIRKSDIFKLKVREDIIEKNGKARRKWTVLKVESHRKAAK